ARSTAPASTYGTERSVPKRTALARRRMRNPAAAVSRLLIGDLTSREDLDVGDQLAHRSTRLPGIAPQLALELDAAPVAQRAVAQLEVGSLHLATPIEQAIDLGEDEEPDGGRGRAVGDREEAREEADVMTVHLVGELAVRAHDDQAEAGLVFPQRGLALPRTQRSVPPCHAPDRPPQARPLDGRQD